MERAATATALLLLVVLLAGCTVLSDEGPGSSGVLNDTRNDSSADENTSTAEDDGTTNGSADGSATDADEDDRDGKTDDGAGDGQDGTDGSSGDDGDDDPVWLSGRIQGVESTNIFTVELDNGTRLTFRLADVQVLPRKDQAIDRAAWSPHLVDAEDSCVELQQELAWEWASAFRYEDVDLGHVGDGHYVVYDEDGDDVAMSLLADGLARVTGSDAPSTDRYREVLDRAKGERDGIWSCADEAIVFE